MFLNIKSLYLTELKNIMYNRNMTSQQPRKRSSMLFLVLGMTFLTIGITTDQTAFTWVAIVFVLVALVRGGKWLGKN